MRANLPPKVRFAIYIFVGIGGIIMSYLATVGMIGQAETALWAALSAFVGGLAALNTDTE